MFRVDVGDNVVGGIDDANVGGKDDNGGSNDDLDDDGDGDIDDGDNDDGDDDGDDDDSGRDKLPTFLSSSQEASGAANSMLHWSFSSAASLFLFFPDFSAATSSRLSRLFFSSSLFSLDEILISRLREDFFGPGFDFLTDLDLKRKWDKQ